MKTVLKFFVIALISTSAFAQFTQAPLPYAYDALEPFVDAQTMEIHYSKHHAGYVNNLNKALKEAGMENNTDMNAILGNMSKYSTAIRNNAGGHYNHNLFWNVLTPNKNTKLSDELTAVIEITFGSMEAFKTQLTQAAATRFGSGWAWLVVTPDNRLVICSTPNQDNPLMDDAPVKGTPIFGIYVWEHAYYLKYQNKRGDYLQAIWSVVNWDEVSRLYAQTQVK
ncbi:MAG TPA: superoxide dismutase [Lutibacter sp.]|nr:superoxide dismutase [Lutibacter sp.]